MTIKIVAIHNHDSFNADLCSVPDTEWWHLTNKDNGHIAWGAGARKQPGNLHELPYVKLTDIDWRQFDVCLVHSVERFAFLRHAPVKKIYLDHTLPYPLFQGAPHMEIKRDPWVRRVVFLTEEQVLTWRMPPLEVEVIAPMIDVDAYPEWRKDAPLNKAQTGAILTICNNLPERNWCCGWDVWRYCTHGLPRTLAGEGNEQAGSDACGFKSGGEIAQMLASYSCYFNTNTHSAVGTSLLEAMAVGMPIVSVDKWVAHTYMVNSDTHFRPRNVLASNVMPELRQYLKDVLADPMRYQAMGQAARKAARELFSPAMFRQEWKRVLEEVANES